MKAILAALALTAATVAAPAQAATFTENFDSPDFAGWTTRFFGANSNATNALRGAERGNNVTGLSVDDGDEFDGGEITVLFDSAFASSLVSFSFDVLAYNQQTLSIFDAAGTELTSVEPTPIAGPPFDFAQSNYTNVSVNSTTGIGGFSFKPFGAAGNISIDNLVAVTAAIPEPSTWALMIGGFGLAGGALRRRQRVSVRFA